MFPRFEASFSGPYDFVHDRMDVVPDIIVGKTDDFATQTFEIFRAGCKRDLRKLWIARINAATRLNGTT